MFLFFIFIFHWTTKNFLLFPEFCGKISFSTTGREILVSVVALKSIYTYHLRHRQIYTEKQNGPEPNLPIKQSVTIDTMINIDGGCDGHGHGDGTFKRTLRWCY